MTRGGPGTPMNATKVNHCVEDLCLQGCTLVRRFIDDLQAGRPVPGSEDLGEEERQALLQELRSIMSVYDGT
jgi:hypothetical protein